MCACSQTVKFFCTMSVTLHSSPPWTAALTMVFVRTLAQLRRPSCSRWQALQSLQSDRRQSRVEPSVGTAGGSESDDIGDTIGTGGGAGCPAATTVGASSPALVAATTLIIGSVAEGPSTREEAGP